MIVLREAIKEKKGNDLLERLADVWKQFYVNILPTLLAIFYPVQEEGIYIRPVTLVGFRDIVLLKTKIHDALEPGQKVSGEIKQMLLVLASVHDSSPPNENYMRLEQLVTRVVRPYLGVNGFYSESQGPSFPRISSETKFNTGVTKERKLSRSQLIKEEMSRKLRRSSSASPNTNENNNQQNGNNNKDGGSFRSRFRLGASPSVNKSSSSMSDGSELTKTMADNDMLDYLEVRNQKWKNKEEMLISESLI